MRLYSLSLLTLLVACSSSSSPSSSGGGGDASVASSNDGGSTPATSDASATEDASTAQGFRVTAATNAALVGGYDIKLDAFVNGAETAYNGSLPLEPTPAAAKPRIEMEIVTDAPGAIKRAHFWSYDAAGTAPDKFYGCDGSAALPCVGVTVDATKKIVSFASVTWKEVTPDLTGRAPDTVVSSGGTVTLAGDAAVN